MAELMIRVVDQAGTEKAKSVGEEQAILVYENEYRSGDRIFITTSKPDQHYIVRIDDCMEESFVYLTKTEVEYQIPFDEKKISYNPKAFSGERHYLTIREAKDYEIKEYRNLAKNPMDQHGDLGCFPHAHANVETRGESVFAARNAIDGVLANASHGAWPYQSWGINQQEDAQMTVEFGRAVDIDKVVLYTRADFPHDNWWIKATLSFSDGSSEVITMEKDDKPHCFSIVKKGITEVTISDLIKADDPSPFPALTQIEVYGRECI